MKKRFIILPFLLIAISCSSVKELSGKKFVYHSLNRELLLSFENDTLCSFKNIFYCDDVNYKFKEITTKATYKRESGMIIIKNVACKNNDCVFPPVVDIPLQKSSKCVFLNEEGRNSKTVFDGRTYQSDYYKYGLVPNIDIDTMYIYKNKITLVKKIGKGSFGFIFQ